MPVNSNLYFKNASWQHVKPFAFVLILFFAFSFRANAQLFRVDTIHCTVNETDTTYLYKMIRHEGAFYNQVFNTHKNDTVAVNINLYGNDKEYTKALKLNKFKVFTNGMYSPELNKTFVYKNEIYMHVILHAVSNNLLHSNYPDAPRWLTEGMASVMSNTDEMGNKKIVYVPLYYYNKQVKDIVLNGDVDFDHVFTSTLQDWNDKASSPGLHSLSYAIVYFLMNQKKDCLTPVILSMKEGHTATDAITSSYGSFDDFKNRFTNYYRFAAPLKPE